MELVLTLLVDYGVASVVAALETRHHLALLGQVVDDATLALVAPLSSHYYCCWHDAPVSDLFS